MTSEIAAPGSGDVLNGKRYGRLNIDGIDVGQPVYRKNLVAMEPGGAVIMNWQVSQQGVLGPTMSGLIGDWDGGPPDRLLWTLDLYGAGDAFITTITGTADRAVDLVAFPLSGLKFNGYPVDDYVNTTLTIYAESSNPGLEYGLLNEATGVTTWQSSNVINYAYLGGQVGRAVIRDSTGAVKFCRTDTLFSYGVYFFVVNRGPKSTELYGASIARTTTALAVEVAEFHQGYAPYQYQVETPAGAVIKPYQYSNYFSGLVPGTLYRVRFKDRYDAAAFRDAYTAFEDTTASSTEAALRSFSFVFSSALPGLGASLRGFTFPIYKTYPRPLLFDVTLLRKIEKKFSETASLHDVTLLAPRVYKMDIARLYDVTILSPENTTGERRAAVYDVTLLGYNQKSNRRTIREC